MFLEVCLLLLLLSFLLYKSSHKPASMPPGTFGLPVIGNLPSPKQPLVTYLLELKRKYGGIFTTKWGSRLVVGLADPAIIKRVLNHPDMQGRIDVYSFRAFFYPGNNGIINGITEVWKQNRRFVLHNLRNLGMGKSRIEDSIHYEVQMIVSSFEKNQLNKPTEIELSVNVAVLNIIWTMLAGLRYSADDAVIVKYNQLIIDNVAIIQGPAFFPDFMPWIQNVVPDWLLQKLTSVDVMIKNRDKFSDFCLGIINEHKKNLDPDNPVDVIDHYLLEIEANKDNPDSPFKSDYRNLVVTMIDLFFAGSETISNTIRWTIFYMAMYPEIQAKVQKLFDEVVPKDQLPSLQDRGNLDYFEAVLLDIQRIASLTPLGVPHAALADVNVEGYFIPKGTMIIPCLELCHRDPAHWEKPAELYPEHFLDKNGKLDGKKDAYMPFSLGRRQCLGEGLARMEVFLFTSAILQKFVITPPPGVTMVPKTDVTKLFLNMPCPFKVVMKLRH